MCWATAAAARTPAGDEPEVAIDRPLLQLAERGPDAGWCSMSARVLLVDDNPFDRELAAWALRKIPCPPGPIELLCAPSWDEARVLLAPGDIDLLLLDYGLPGCTGLDILRTELTTRHPRVIVVTGHDDVGTAVATMREGAFDYVPKGLDWGDALARSVAQALVQPAS